MKDQRHRYMLLIEHAQTAMGREAVGASFTAHTAPVLAEVLIPMFSIPCDQLHPDAAILNDHKNFVRNLSVIDLADGKLLFSTIYEPTAVTRRDDNVYFVAEAGVDPGLFGIPVDLFGARIAMDAPAVFELVSWHPSGDFMSPTPAYEKLLTASLQHGLAANESFLPYHFHCEQSGFSLNGLEEAVGPFYAPPIHIIHKYDNLADAMAKLLQTPGAAFDGIAVINTGQENLITGASVTIGPGKSEVVAMLGPKEFVDPPEGKDNKPGLYLGYYSPATEVLAAFGITPANTGDTRPLVCLYDHKPLHPNQYLPTPLFEEAQSKLLQTVSSSADKDFELIVSFTQKRQNQTGQAFAHNDRIEERHLHTQQLQAAMFESVLASAPMIAQKAAANNAAQTIDIRILNRDKSIIWHLCTSPSGMDEPGNQVYMGIATELFQHPDLQHLWPSGLIRNGPLHTFGQLSYVPITDPLGKSTASGIAYRIFTYNLTTDFLYQQLTRRPALSKFSPEHTHAASFDHLITLNWELNTPLPTHGNKLTTCARPVPTAATGIEQIELLASSLFDGKDLASQSIPLRLTSASLWKALGGDEYDLIFQKKVLADTDRHLVRALYSNAPDDIAAFCQTVGADFLESARAQAQTLQARKESHATAAEVKRKL